MTAKSPKKTIRMAFEASTLRVNIADILPLRAVRPALKSTKKYTQIVASIRELGIIEPPVIARRRGIDGKFLLLDGHLRIEALKDMEVTEVVCLLSTDDEAVTYNRRVSRIAIVQEHRMIMKAIERGVPEQRIAKALLEAMIVRHRRPPRRTLSYSIMRVSRLNDLKGSPADCRCHF